MRLALASTTHGMYILSIKTSTICLLTASERSSDTVPLSSCWAPANLMAKAAPLLCSSGYLASSMYSHGFDPGTSASSFRPECLQLGRVKPRIWSMAMCRPHPSSLRTLVPQRRDEEAAPEMCCTGNHQGVIGYEHILYKVTIIDATLVSYTDLHRSSRHIASSCNFATAIFRGYSFPTCRTLLALRCSHANLEMSRTLRMRFAS
jgi:hypothetical protein